MLTSPKPREAGRISQTFPQATRSALKLTSARALRFYRKIANNRLFAKQIAQAQRGDDPHDALEKLIRPLYAADIYITGAYGFLASFLMSYPTNAFGIFARGKNSSDPTAEQLQIMAEAVFPLYRRISLNNRFADRIVRAINAGNSAELSRTVREIVKSSRLRQVEVYRDQPSPEFEPDIGFNLIFQFGNQQYECTIA